MGKTIPVKFTTNGHVVLDENIKNQIGTNVVIRFKDFVKDIDESGGNFRVSFDSPDSFTVSIENISSDLQDRINNVVNQK